MSRHVLVVDDDDSIREVAQMTLQLLAGWQVSTAASGTETIELLRELRPDVILMDVMMPGLDGPSTVLRLRADPTTADIPVIMLTAKDITTDQRRELGLSGVISKPFDPLTLGEEMATILGWAE